jgi:5-methylcytosine-specific restriction endonuclease McrA
MNKAEYQKYLKSDHWKMISEEARRLAGYRCQVCNSKHVLNVHHRTYERLGYELQSDLTVLCDDCHSLFSNRHDAQEFTGWGLVRSLTDALRAASKR